MTTTYCETDPVSGRWTGVGRLLTAFEVDYNFYQHDTRLATLEGEIGAATVGISYVTLHGDQLTIVLTDHSIQGPFTIPLATFRDRNTWAPSTSYSVNDTFDINGTLYLVIFAHVSGLSFDPNANDGMGHDYYTALLTVPGNALPAGGATAQVLQKASSTDYSVTWGYKLPTGGAQYQVLMKNSGTNQDASWSTIAGIHVTFTPASGSPLTSTDVTDAINELYSHVEAQFGTVTQSFSGLTDVSLHGQGAGSLIFMNSSNLWTNTPASPNTNDLPQWDGTEWTTVQPSTFSLSFTQMTDNLTLSQLIDSTFTNLGSAATGTISIDPTVSFVYDITLAGNVTLNALNLGTQCQEITIFVYNTSGTNYVLTFGTNFVSQGPLATGSSSSKAQLITFVSDGFTWREKCRSVPTGVVALGATGTVSLDPYASASGTYSTTPTGNITLNAASGGWPGSTMRLIVYQTTTTNNVITFSTNFKTTGTLSLGTVSGKTFIMEFVSDGTTWYEKSRTTAL